jgi:sugar phosphate isomerase/epimerase
MDRRQFAGISAAALASGLSAFSQQRSGGKFRISLAEWSIHKAIQSRLMTNLEFPRVAREQFGIEGLEFVNQLWEAPTQRYVTRLKDNMRQTGTQAVLIMIDGEGDMGSPDKAARMSSSDSHRKWVDITAELGGHAIRCNMLPGPKQPGTPAEVDAYVGYCAESFSRLSEYAKGANINIVVENHGAGASSNPDIIVRMVQKVNLPNFGTLPDFGNFAEGTDRYAAVAKLMPFAKGVSFKCWDFTPDARETKTDMDRMMKVVSDAGYNGWVGIEYEGTRLTEFEGVQFGKRCLERYL